jgi:uncharacterized protein (TIGR03118 family)
MKIRTLCHRASLSALCIAAVLLGSAPAALSDDVFQQTNLVSDIPGTAVTTDPNLINPWGIASTATSPYWISDQGTGVATLYNGLGTPTALVVTIPAAGPPSGPTGVVSVPTGVTGFSVNGTTAHFIFANLNGSIDAWAAGTTAVQSTSVSGAVFTGLALANNGSGNFLYAANFSTGGGVDVFNSSFQSTTLSGSFKDPNLPAGYAPYNIQNLNGQLFVQYAKVGTRGAQTGAGFGYVDVYDLNGNFVKRLVSNGPLNAPWGVAIAPTGFGSFSNDLLIGNFGDGEINAFDPTSGNFIGTLVNSSGDPILNPGLWGIQFGNSNAGSTPNTLFFNAGINGEKDGLFGSITQATPEPSTLLLLLSGIAGLFFIRRKNAGWQLR